MIVRIFEISTGTVSASKLVYVVSETPEIDEKTTATNETAIKGPELRNW